MKHTTWTLTIWLFLLLVNDGLGQCLDDDIIMFPPKSTDLFTGFGRDVILQDDYLIVSANNSDSLSYESGAIYVYEFVNGQWEETATLTPSVPTKFLQIGNYMRASSTMIVARANTFTEDGYKHEVVYVFEKEENEKWVSQHESYIFNPVTNINPDHSGTISLTFDVMDSLIWVYHHYLYYDDEFKANYHVKNSIYHSTGGSASLIEDIGAVMNEDNTFYYHPLEVHLRFGTDFMVAAFENYQISAVYESGKVFVYNYADGTGWDPEPVELPKPLPRQIGFGTYVSVHENNIFVTNNRDESQTGENRAKVFVYEKDGANWSSSEAIATLQIPDVRGSSSDRVIANEKYVIHTIPSEQSIQVFAKDGVQWTSVSESDFKLNIGPEERGYGWELAINSNHFVYNANDFAFSDFLITGSEVYTVQLDDDFEAIEGDHDQVLDKDSFTASGDEFARNSSFYKSFGVVGTNLDNDKGVASGALNIYKRSNEDLSWVRTAKVYSPNSQAYQNFGLAVAVSENYLFASSPFYDSLDANGDNYIFDLGKVYQFERTEGDYRFVQEILSPDIGLAPTSGSATGRNSSSQANFETIQTTNDDINIGEKMMPFEASLFQTNSSQALVAPHSETTSTADYHSYRQFGKTIVYHNGYLAIGQRYFGGSNYKGRIYLFKEALDGSWTHQATLQLSDKYSRDALGQYPFVMNDTLIVAGSAGYSQQAFIFKRQPGEEWHSGTEDAVLLPDRSGLVTSGNYPIEEFDNFGVSIDMYKNTIVVGAPYGERDDRLGAHSGRAYIYEMPAQGWDGEISYKHILKPENRIVNGSFGYSVYIDQNNVLVGAPHSILRRRYAEAIFTETDEKRGRVYVFDRNVINANETVVHEVGQILPTGGHSFDLFGARIEKNFLEVVVSAPMADTENGERSGSAYMFKKVGAIEEDIPPLCKESGIIDLISYPVTGGTWSGDGIIDSSTGLFDPSGLDEGVYSVSYQYGECTTSTNISVYTKPEIVASSPHLSNLCVDGTLDLFAESNKAYHDYSWFYKELQNQSYEHENQWAGQASITVDKPGYYYCISSNPGCNSEPVYFEVAIAEVSTAVNQAEESTFCEGESPSLALISPAQMDSYNWYFSNDPEVEDFQSIGMSEDLQVSASGFYFCEFEYLGCTYYSDTAQFNFAFERSELNLNDEYQLCVDESIDLSVATDDVSMIQYEWYQDVLGFGDYSLFTNDAIASVDREGSFFCKSTSQVGCIYYSDTLRINQDQVSLSFAEIGIICDTRTVEFEALPQGGTFTIVNSGMASFNTPSVHSENLGNGQYEVLYEYETNGCIYRTSQMLEIDILDNEEIFVPNVFTPNGDGLNDAFYVKLGDRPVSSFDFTITNRNGKTLFHAENPDFKWDGGNLPSGVYYWGMSYGNNCSEQRLKGYVQIFR